jgi:GTP-binding protein
MWGPMIVGYLRERGQLRVIVLLVDSRHAPSANDLMMVDWLRHYGYRMVVAATKADKLGRGGLAKRVGMLRKELAVRDGEDLIPFSVNNNEGRDALWQILIKIIEM